jgi:hypothetical protein
MWISPMGPNLVARNFTISGLASWSVSHLVSKHECIITLYRFGPSIVLFTDKEVSCSQFRSIYKHKALGVQAHTKGIVFKNQKGPYPLSFFLF